jgi:hypothetical protein
MSLAQQHKGTPTGEIVEETVFIQLDLVEQLVIEVRESPW